MTSPPRRAAAMTRSMRVAAALVVLLAIAVPVPAKGASKRRPVEKRETASASRPPDVRFDFEAVDSFLGFVSRGGATDEELERWSRLPANRELLRQGRLEGGLTPDILKEAARVTIAGGVFPGPPTLGRIDGGDWAVLRQILGALQSDQQAMAASATRALTPYLPADRPLPPLSVRFHIGGSWGGRTTDAVYINLTFFQSRGVASLPGLDALLVHEIFHLAQAALLPAIEDYGSPQSALHTLLLRIEQEGIARHLEYRRLLERAAGTEMDRTNLARYEDGLRRARDHAELLARFQVALTSRRMEEVRRLASEGLHGGGPLYAVGHAMAASIETASGAAVLASTVTGGPLEFVRAYLGAAGETPLLPAGMIASIDEVARGYARNPVRASRLRREGLRLLVEDRPGDATDVLKEATRLDPSDATSAYNLACAWALLGRESRALRWLETAFDRGFTGYKHAANDEDLEILRDRPEFEAMLRSRGFDYRRPGSRPRSTP